MTDKQQPVAWAVYKGDECLRVHEKREWAEDWAGAEAHFGSVGPYHIRELFAAPPAQPDHQGHSCTHKCTWPQCEAAQPAPAQEPQPVSNTDELPQRLSDEMDAIAIKHAHKMALDLECILAEYGGSWYNTAMQTLGEYRSEMNAIHERESPTFMGEPLIAAAPKKPAMTRAERRAQAEWLAGADLDDGRFEEDEVCPECDGLGTDKWCDHLLPCPLCQGGNAMTRAEIAAELRRSACEDDDPWQCDPSAFYFAVSNFVVDRERLLGARHDDLRILYLIVAEAIND